jgi:myosin heavy subunit
LRRIRNYIAHNKTEGSYEQTREILGVLLAVALDIELAHCVNEYAGAIKRIEALDQGIKFEDNLSTQNRVEEFEDKSAELEELLFEEKAKSARIAQLLEEARSVVVIKEIEFEALSESEQAKTEETTSMKSELFKAQQEAEELKVQLEENAQRTEDLKKSEANLKNLVASFVEAPAKMFTPNSATDEARTESTKHENNYGSGESPVTNAPGTLWSRPKGNRKVVLSVSSRDLVETKNGKVLEGTDPKQTKTFAESWLTIRPQGGRIFIDSDGHASTLIDDKLIYLGNVAGLFHKGI